MAHMISEALRQQQICQPLADGNALEPDVFPWQAELVVKQLGVIPCYHWRQCSDLHHINV